MAQPRVAETDAERFHQTVRRAKAYVQAGADCIHLVVLGDLGTLKRRLPEAVQAPINVLALTCRATLREPEDAGIARLSWASPWCGPP
jgi:2-methylisocitrate lyase-like PEP mutase family enzyme